MASSYLEIAQRETAECRRRTVSYLTRGNNVTGTFTSEAGNNVLDSASRKMAMNARDQIGRFRDQVHTSVKPIATRIGGRPYRLARIGKAAPGKRSAEPMQYFRRECHELLVRNFGASTDADVELIDQHPILDRLNRPSDSMPWVTGQMMKQVTPISLCVTGYSCWWMPKGKEVLYLPPQWVRPVTTPKGLFQGWKIRPEGHDEDTDVPAEDMAYFVHMDPANPMKALGPLEAGIRTVMVQEYVQEALKRAFQLGIHPQAIIKLAVAETKDGKPIHRRLRKWQMDQMREAIMQRHRGVINYGLPWFIDSMVSEVKPWTTSAKDMDFGMNADKTQAAVEQTFGTNPYIAGGSGSGNRAESAEAERHFVYSTVNPLIELMSHVLTFSVAPRLGGDGLVLFIEPARPDDSEMEFNYAKDGNASGKITVNEYRVKYMGIDPVPWGDAVWAPRGQALIPTANLMGGYVPPVGAGGQAVPAISTLPTDPAVAQDDAPSPEQQDAEDETTDDEEAGKAHRPFDRKLAARYNAMHRGQERSLVDALMPLFKRQRTAVAAKLAEHYRTAASLKNTTGLVIARRLFDPAEWTGPIKEIAREQLAHGMASGARHELGAFTTAKDGSFDLEFEFGREFPKVIVDGIAAGLSETMAQDYWAGISQTQLDDLGRKLQEAIEAGNTPRELVDTVSDVFDGTMGRERARRIASTESTWAVGKGAQVAREHLADEGIVDGKEWAATHDMRTRDTHSAANGQTRGVKEDFMVGGYAAQAPGDPRLPAKERVHCRCAALSTVQTKSVRGAKTHTCGCDGSPWPYQAA